MRLFLDRRDAGRQLAARLCHLRDEHPVVVGLPRGGVPVAFEVARELDAPLDVIVVRKLGVPHQPEFGMGAIGEDDVRVLNEDIVRLAGVSPVEVAAVEARERVEVRRRADLYRGGRPMIPLVGQTVIVVDDGIATGGTARAALEVARAHGARRVVLAVPVAPSAALAQMRDVADEVVAIETPMPFLSVGQWYAQFTQTPDDEVIRLLRSAAQTPALSSEVDPPGDDPRPAALDEEIEIATDGVRLGGHLSLPPQATAVVIFAHGSGSSRHSPRNQFVAQQLNASGLGTLLFDLLTPEEALDRDKVFDIELLAHRLARVVRWLRAAARVRGPGRRVLRRQHGCRSCALRGGRRPRSEGGRVAGGSPRPRHELPRRGARSHPAHRRR